MEVWLPLSGWNGKFVGVANFGTGGVLQYRHMIQPLSSGYALAANDTGHSGGGGEFAVGHPEKMIDYAYRADHEMTLRAKEIVVKFFGRAPSRSIWIGCSLGGVEALIEAKRYPQDYDGIVAGAPPNPFPLFNAEQIWGAWLNFKHPEGAIPATKFAMVHQAALKACGTPVGLAQGFIEDPEHCGFDPGVLLCKGGDAADCLTVPQVERMRQLYAGPLDPRTHKVIFPGPAVGAENELVMSASQPVRPAVDLYRYLVYQDPNWDWKSMDYAASVDKAVKELSPLLAVDADLSAFLDRGGKLMLYVGWTEGHNANDLAKYYQAVLKHVGPTKANNVRLFLVPGMNHCGGGAGCDTFEKVGVVDQWVESGKAPEQILSSKLSGGRTVRTRPLCAYPAVAKYTGAGSMDDAGSFHCAIP
jgi:feruloyl esterase